MITLKLAYYSDEEKKNLISILDKGLRGFQKNCTKQCSSCHDIKACTDVARALDYLSDGYGTTVIHEKFFPKTS